MNVKVLSKILLIILWLGTFFTGLVWVFVDQPPFDPEPITLLLGLISTAVTALFSEFSNRLQREEYSTSYALAYGYVNNFLDPVVTAISMRTKPGEPLPSVYIYLPKRLEDLEPASVERLLARMREKNLTSHVVNLELKEGRARDILVVQGTRSGSIYFDFPSTLLTLKSLIEYKMESKSESFVEQAKEKLGHVYILKFKEAIEKMLARKNLSDRVKFTDDKLELG